MSVKLADFSDQGENVNSFISSFYTGNVPHAAIIDGPAGTGKKTLCALLCQVLFCENRNGNEPCGRCPSCVQVAAGTHPDLIQLSREKALVKGTKPDRKSIGIDDIRELIALTGVFTTTGKRIVCIEDSESLTVDAQNSLLKTLEEPPEGTCFILITEHPEALLTTVVSRCRRIHLRPWSDEYIYHILLSYGIPKERCAETVVFCGGSIGKAMNMAKDDAYWDYRKYVMDSVFGLQNRSDIFPVSAAYSDKNSDFELLLDTVESILTVMMYVRSRKLSSKVVDQYPIQWKQFAENADIKDFDKLFEQIRKARMMRASNVNQAAILENLLFVFMEEQSKWYRS